ncbi:MAG TPA: NAD-dependent epimerase/dehydratase family protein [Mycobacteriales bacterium]|nr:NAD-dependent epimerase/dehydratase family protein [Mycobacteriales bacterium]
MRVVVTGGAGFIGSRLRTACAERGWDVTGVDIRATDGVLAGDVTEPGAWTRLLDGADVVVHTAALVGERGDAAAFDRVNVDATGVVLAAAAKAGVGRTVHVSSIVVHGASFPVPPGGVLEDDRVRPTGNPYTDTKIAAEHLALLAAARGQPVVIVRPGDVYGPGSAQWTVRPVEMLQRRQLMLIGGGHGVLCPVYIADLVDGLVAAATAEAALGEVFHVTGGVGVTAREFFGRYAAMLGKRGIPSVPRAVVRATGPAARLARRWGRDLPVSPRTLEYIEHPGPYSNAKARDVLGWTPRVDLDEGMRRCEEWLRAEGIVS